VIQLGDGEGAQEYPGSQDLDLGPAFTEWMRRTAESNSDNTFARSDKQGASDYLDLNCVGGRLAPAVGNSAVRDVISGLWFAGPVPSSPHPSMRISRHGPRRQRIPLTRGELPLRNEEA
jgi:hypothetical protein